MNTDAPNQKNTFRNLQSVISAQRLGLFIAFVALCLTLSFLSPYFLTQRNLLNVLVQSSINTILAVGMTFVIVSGGIDLSVGSALALTGVVMARLVASGWNVSAAIAAGLLCGLAIGAANGFCVVRIRIPAFIVTLGALSIARGLAFVAAGGKTIPVVPAGLRVWGESQWAGIPIPTIIAVLLVIVGHVVLTRTVFGRHLTALGHNERATQYAGINTSATKWVAYVISGFAVFLGALISVGRLGSADPIRGEGYELDAIAAVIIGGTSLMGGRGSVLGTLLGALLIAVLRNGLNLQDVTAAWQQVIIGAVIVGAVFLDRIRSGKGEN